MKRNGVRVVAALLLLSLVKVDAVYRNLFYYFGDRVGDRALPRGDMETAVLSLSTPISYFDDVHYTVYLNTDGILTFTPGLQGYAPYPFGTDFVDTNIKLIAPFLADLDNSNDQSSGNIWYRETDDPNLRDRANQEINRLSAGADDFKATSLLIITWEDVTLYRKDGVQARITFQVVLASDGSNTYAIYLYDDGNQYPDLSRLSDVDWPQIGFYAGDGSRYFTLEKSMTKDVFEESRQSNVNTPGFWLWQIGMPNMLDKNIVDPSIVSIDVSSGDSDTSQSGPEVDIFDVDVFDIDSDLDQCSECHTNARCVAGGLCCECIENYYGNGLVCLEEGVPQRVNGKLSGRVNGVQLDNIDLHSYTVTREGRAYTAISRVPATIGLSMQALQPINAAIGWVFSMATGKGRNGFDITGGSFTLTADVQFENGDRMTTKYRFEGVDDAGYNIMSVEVDGTLPAITPSERITVDDYKETYTRTSPGYIKCYSERVLQLPNGSLRFTVDQTIEYEECVGDAQQQRELIKAMRVSVKDNYATYDRDEQILRYAMASKSAPSTEVVEPVEPEEPEIDPCQTNNCHRLAQCIRQDDVYYCQCRTGYEGDGITCVDLNECRIGNGGCHNKARCVNQEGTHTCECLPGYTGDGRECTREQVTPGTGAFLLYNQGMGMYRLPLNEYEAGSRILLRPGHIAIGIGFDCREEHVYWTDLTSRAIIRAKYNGEEVETLIELNKQSSPEGVAIDWISRNMYWTDSGMDTIEVANLDGLNRRVIISDGLVNPRAIVVDPVGSYMYWTDWNREAPKIETSNLDGSDRHVLVEDDLGIPNALTLDYVNHQICWADAGKGTVECISQNGDPATRYTVTSEAEYPFALTNAENRLYWTDWERDNIQNVNINGGNLGRPMQPLLEGKGRLYGLTAVTTCPSGSNACEINNGGCSHLCLALPGGQHTCKCPSGQQVNEVPCVE